MCWHQLFELLASYKWSNGTILSVPLRPGREGTPGLQQALAGRIADGAGGLGELGGLTARAVAVCAAVSFSFWPYHACAYTTAPHYRRAKTTRSVHACAPWAVCVWHGCLH